MQKQSFNPDILLEVRGDLGSMALYLSCDFKHLRLPYLYNPTSTVDDSTFREIPKPRSPMHSKPSNVNPKQTRTLGQTPGNIKGLHWLALRQILVLSRVLEGFEFRRFRVYKGLWLKELGF